MAKRFGTIEKRKMLLMVIAAVAAVAVIITGAVLITGNRSKKIQTAQDFFDTVHSYRDLTVVEDTKYVTAAQECLDVKGKTIAYVVTAYGEGFADKVSVRCFFDLKKKTLIGIQVAEQYETNGSGANIATSMFTQRFEYTKMPLWFNDGSISEEDSAKMKGTCVDTLSGATVSSRAVVEAVNAAYTYYVDNM